MSDHWFNRFKTRYCISLTRPTNTAQMYSDTLQTSIQQFYRYIRQTATNKQRDFLGIQAGAAGPWDLNQIANIDQTSLESCFNTKGATYSTTGEKTVWARSTGSGHDKMQCTVQLTVFADGEPRMKPLLIFKGTGQRIPEKETRQYDSRVVVKFQKNAWCDEEIMVVSLRYMWNARKNFCGENRSKLLVYDEHKAQTSEKVKQILDRECHTILALMLPGATSKVQPLDVAFNSEFKRSVDHQATEFMAEDPEIFLTSKLTDGDRRVLFTKWVGKSWQETSHLIKDTVIGVPS